MPDGSEPLDNSRQERFALELAKGSAAGPAYAKAGYKRDDACASRLTRNAKVKARVAWLKKQSETATTLTMQEKREIAASIARGSERDSDRLSAIKVDNDLAGDGAEAEGNKGLAALIGRLRR